MNNPSRIPLSLEQERMWFLFKLHGAIPAFHERAGAWLQGELDIPLLRQTLVEVSRRHEILRTGFVEVGEQPWQRIAPEIELAWREEDAKDEETALTLAREEVSRPFDLEQGPLWRACLIKLAPQRHLLVVTMHHIISDGDWTLGLFFSEIFSLYTARRNERPAEVPPLELQYRDHALRQREQLRGERIARHLAWWREQLQGMTPALDLPVDRSRPSVQSFAGATVERSAAPELGHAARQLAQREGVSLFAVLLAGLQAVLYRYTRQDDVPVGTPLAGRQLPDMQHLLGYFGNPVVLRGRVGDDPSFRQLVHRTEQDFLQAQAHGELSFKDLVEALAPARDLSRPPLFQVLFILRDPWPSHLTSPSLTLTPVDIELPFVSYELMASAQDQGTRLSLKLEYNRELFLPETVAQLLGHWEVLLRGALELPEQRISELPLLSSAEEHQLLHEWNQTRADYPRDVTIHEVIQDHVRRTPEAVALVSGDRQLTYRELDRRARRVARALRQRGVKTDDRVALCTQRSPETIIAMLGILQAGAAYVPLDPEFPVERLAWMIEDAQARVLVAVGAPPPPIPVEGLEILRVDAEEAPPDDEDLAPPPSGALSENLAYVIYTSGSTGIPKGVGIAHRSVVQLAFHSDVRPDDRVLQSATYSFDMSVFDIWVALLNGARVVIGARDVNLSAKALGEELRRQGITVSCMPPAVFNNLVREAPFLFQPLRAVIAAGDALDPNWIRVALKEGGPRLFNGYGPTETTVFTHLHPISEVTEDATSVPLGRPIRNVQAYVLDRHLRPVPRGVPGELYIGGEGLARGYWRRPELTAERFIPNPFSQDPGARLYKTGDLVRYLPDGLLDFLGRIDHQVKIRGFRIEIGEIEAVLADHPEVREVVVSARVLGTGDKQLVAYIVPQLRPPPSVSALREFLASKLPPYMVPAFFVMLDALPLNSNGKVDRQALPLPGGTRPELAQEFVAPRTPTEQALATLWKESLSLDRVGRDDDFFALGGHSLRAMQVVSRIRQQFQVEIPLRAFFSHPTLAGMANLVSGAGGQDPAASSASSITSASRGSIVPLSFSQERLWFLQQLAPASAAYNYPAFFRIHGPLEADVLEQSLQALVSRHESLRTRFSEIDGQPMQVIAAHLPPRLERADLRSLPREAREQEVLRRAEADARHPFDLHRGPLLRATLLELGDDEHVLLVNLHHSVTDGWSMDVLYGELEALYGALTQGETPDLPALALQYADYAIWQRQWAESRALEKQLTWWKEQLAGVPPILDLPTDRPRPPVQDFRGALVPFQIDRETTAALRALAAQERVTPTMVLLAAFQTLLHRYTGQEEFLVGMPHANRERSELAGVVGFFVNTLAMRANLSEEPSFRTLLARVRETSLGAHEHSRLPFERLVKALRPERDLSTLPLVQVMFAPQVSKLGRLKLPGLSVEPLAVDPGRATFDLTLCSWEEADTIGGQWEYSTALFERSTLERMAGHLSTLLGGAVRQPDARLSGLPILGDEERQQLLARWNDTAVPYPRESTIPEAFAEQVLRAPEAVAVRFGSEQLTYRQLDLRANQIAWRLRRMGVGPDSRVAIAMGRSVELVVALVGILKAGGAYVPLDTDYPRERLALMLEAAQPDALITTTALLPKIPPRGLRHLLLLDDARLEEEPTSAPDAGVTGRNLAYISFTSGSTGRPKGVCIEQRSVLRLVKNIRYAELGPEETLLLASILSFDTSTFELWGSLLTGACLAVFPPHPPADGVEVAEVIARHGVTCLYLSSGLFAQAVDVAAERLASVRHILAAGDVLSAPHARRMVDLGVSVTNAYGPTECTTFATACRMAPHSRVEDPVPLGQPISNTTTYVLDRHMQPVPIGVAGELYLGGDGVARGYMGQPTLTAERFVPDPFGSEPGGRLYRTGDRARWRGDGSIDFLGRLDTQVKVRGHRIELAEVETALLSFPSVAKAVAVAREDTPGQKRLVGYVAAPPELDIAALRTHLSERLPRYMQPQALVRLETLPLTLTGKIDRRALPAPSTARPGTDQTYVAPRSELEHTLGEIWREVLGLERVGVEDAFFDLGGHSLLLAQVRARIRERLKREIGLVTLFQYPTIRQLSAHLTPEEEAVPQAAVPQKEAAPGLEGRAHAIAIIGMAGRFPGARSPRELWELLREGREGLSHFARESLHGSDVSPELLEDPSFVPTLGVLEEAGCFDAAFFGYSPQEAQLTDPQQRLFLESCWEALEDSGYDPRRYPGGIGVFGGAGVPRYWLQRVAALAFPRGSSGEYRAVVGNGNDFLATRVAYKLGLRGPALSLQTACSTSLVATHLACQSLLSRQCDMALAGGVSLFALGPSGYPYEEGGILSPDGHCRPFDSRSQGTVPGSGVAMVVLKRLEDALADGDTIHAVILGSAINNDGSQKVGYTAPSIEGQVEAIIKAQAAAGVSADTLSYVEAHGTATPLGDPIEVAALTKAFQRAPVPKQSCVLGSLKSNLGHLDAAAGVTGLLKVALSLEHELIPATLHFQQPNPELALEDSPFFVSAQSRPWPRGERPRRAAVSSFGLGGTNAHAILEEAPPRAPSGPSRSWQLLPLSARTASALDATTDRLSDRLRQQPELPLADVAFTLQQGRAVFEHRRVVVAQGHEDAASSLASRDSSKVFDGVAQPQPLQVVFMFPGGGTQQVGMGRELHAAEPVYRKALDRCAELFIPELGCDLRSLLFAEESERAQASAQLLRPSLNMASIFSTEYALAQLLLSWGLRPSALTGHSLGEYAAATLAGVLSLDDAVALVALRGRLCDTMPDSAMLSVPLPEEALSSRWAQGVSIAAVNGPANCVVAGRKEAVERLEERLRAGGIEPQRLWLAGASHSPLVEPFAGRLTERAASMKLQAPLTPLVSNLTGTWMSDADARDPSYWARHLRGTVRFADGLSTVLAMPAPVLIEVGPGRVLASLARLHPETGKARLVTSTLSTAGSGRGDLESLLGALGKLWCVGGELDWAAFSREELRRRVPLPTYPFARTEHVLDIKPAAQPSGGARPHSATRSPRRDIELDTASPLPPPPPIMKALPASQDALEQKLGEIWREVLGVPSIRPDDHFFDAGGSSLIALQLRTRVKERLGVVLPVHALVENPRFSQLLAAIRSATPASASPPKAQDVPKGRLLVCLQHGAAETPPLYLVQPIGGTVYTYMSLARQLGPTQPVYAFRASGIEPGESIHPDVPTMAAHYLAELLEHQPQGPFQLGGHSSGGAVAYELARQLLQRGRQVSLVLLLDTPPLPLNQLQVDQPEELLRLVAPFRERAPAAWEGFVSAVAKDSPFRQLLLVHAHALAAYLPGRSQLPLVYLRARERNAVLEPHSERWWMDHTDGPFSMHNVAGDHFSMLEPPHVETLAHLVRQNLSGGGSDPARTEKGQATGEGLRLSNA